MTLSKPRLFALHCADKGFGYAVFEGGAIYDWGTVTARNDKNAMCLKKLEKLLDRFSPETLVMEEAETAARRADRIIELQSEIVILCHNRSIEVAVYLQTDVQRCFSTSRSMTRQEVAEAVARRVDALAPRLPRPRKPWQSEPRRIAIFSAAAVAFTHITTEPDD